MLTIPRITDLNLKACTTDIKVCSQFNTLLRNDVICKNEVRPRAYKQTFEQALTGGSILAAPNLAAKGIKAEFAAFTFRKKFGLYVRYIEEPI